MERMKKVKNWLRSRKIGSTGSLIMGSAQDLTLVDARDQLQSQYELTSIRIRHLLDKKQYQKVVDLLREVPRDHVLNCLESFPFITLNKAIPASFLIWETLLTKLKNSEESYIPQFPYKSCDDLVMRVGWVMENNPGVEEVQHACRRVLKCVYMQYNEVLEQLFKEHERVNYALYTLSRHSPLGLGGPCSALSLEQAIKEEVEASLEDYSTALECMKDLGEDLRQQKTGTNVEETDDVQKLSPTGSNGGGSAEGDENGGDTSKQIGTPQAPNPSPLQLQERLYRNQRIFTSLKPSRRSDTLAQLVDHLKERIVGDKEVIHLFGKIRSRDSRVNKHTPVQPWLRKYEHALDLAIGAIKDIEKDLEITVPRMESPMQFGSGSTLTSEEGGIGMSPVGYSSRPRSKSYDADRPFHRHSAAPILNPTTMEESGCVAAHPPRAPQRNLSIPNSFRPRSASPMKPNLVNRNRSPGPSGEICHAHLGSMKSITSSNDSSSNLSPRNSSSYHDLHSTGDQAMSLAFTRVQSLKANKSVHVVAGKRKQLPLTPNSLTNLTAHSISSSSIYFGSKKKKRPSCGSAELELALERHAQSGEKWTDRELLLNQSLEFKNDEIVRLHLQIQELRKRERALTDRLSEQAQKQLQGSEKFEDILLGSQRPTQVTQAYGELFSQSRVEALDEVDAIIAASQGGRVKDSNYTSQLLLDVLTVSFAQATNSLEQLHRNWKSSLCVDSEPTDSVAVKQVEAAVGLYLRRVSIKYDTNNLVKATLLELSSRYANCAVFQEASSQPQFLTYLHECATICWSLCVQAPPMTLDYGDPEFNPDKHIRLYKSNHGSPVILQYLWPTLVQQSSGNVLSQGHVLT